MFSKLPKPPLVASSFFKFLKPGFSLHYSEYTSVHYHFINLNNLYYQSISKKTNFSKWSFFIVLILFPLLSIIFHPLFRWVELISLPRSSNPYNLILIIYLPTTRKSYHIILTYYLKIYIYRENVLCVPFSIPRTYLFNL